MKLTAPLPGNLHSLKPKKVTQETIDLIHETLLSSGGMTILQIMERFNVGTSIRPKLRIALDENGKRRFDTTTGQGRNVLVSAIRRPK